jgi:hypothetical protein
MPTHKNITTVPKDIVDDILTKMADDVSKEIDFNCLAESLISCGWSNVDLPPFDILYKVNDIVDWAYHHCNGEFKNFGVRFIFEDKKDATLFALKWL